MTLTWAGLVPFVVFIAAAFGAGHSTGALHAALVILAVVAWLAALALVVASRAVHRRERRERV